MKVSAVQSIGPGEYLNFTIYFNNTANYTAAYVWINDTLPPSTVYVSDTAAGLGYAFTRNTSVPGIVRYEFLNVPGNSYNSFVLTVLVNASAMPGTWVNNTVYMNYTDDVGNLMPGSNSTAAVMVDAPVLTLEKTVSLIVANPNDILTYIIWFNNTGTVPAAHVWINDTLPPWVTIIGIPYFDPNITKGGLETFPPLTPYYGWHFENVSVGEHYIVIQVQISPSTPDGTILENNVTCAYQDNYSNEWQLNDTVQTLVIRPVITITKDAPAQAEPGDQFKYWVNFTNSGNDTAPYVWINDTLPAGLGFTGLTSVSLIGGTVWVSGQTLYFNFTDVAPGTYSFWFQVQVNTNVQQNLTNWAFLNYTVDNGYRWEERDDATTAIVRPFIEVAKTVDKAEAYPNDLLTYTIWYNNTGTSPADWVIITDDLPIWVQYITDTSGVAPVLIGPNTYRWSIPNVPVGTHYFNITVRVNSTTPHCEDLVNTVTLEYSITSNIGLDTYFTPSSDTATTHINRPQIRVEKEVDLPVAAPGFFLNYTIYFNNSSPSPALMVWINDTLPFGVSYVNDTAWTVSGANFTSKWINGQYLYFNFTNVQQGVHSFVITVRIDPLTPPGTELWNYVHLDYAAENGFILEFSEDWAYTLVSAMGILKDVDLPLAVQGDYLNYTIRFENTASALASIVWINDTLPTGVTFIGHDANTSPSTQPYFLGFSQSGLTLYFVFINVPQGLYMFNITVQVNTTTPPGTWLNNTARLEWANEQGGAMPGSQDTAETKVMEARIVPEKSASDDPVYPGQQYAYTIWFNNSGETNATWVTVMDILPAGVEYVSHTAATNATHTFVAMAQSGQYLWINFTSVQPGVHFFSLTVRVNMTQDNYILVNEVRLNYSTGTFDYPEERAWANITLVMPNVTVAKAPALQYASIGDLVTFTITFTNAGYGTASYIWINDTLPSGLSYVSDTSGTSLTAAPYLASNGTSGQYLYFNFTDVPPDTYSFTITARVDPGIANGTILTNVVDLDYTTYDWNYTAVSASADVIVLLPNITVQKSVNRNVISPGDYLTYTITFDNTGWWPAARVWINDTLPSGVLYWSDTAASVVDATFLPPTGSSGSNLYFNFTNVQIGAHSFQVLCYVLPSVSNGSLLQNWAFLNYSLESGYLMPPSQDDAVTLVTVMAVVKSVSDAVVRAGQFYNYTIYFNNTAAYPILYAWINDTLPVGVEYVNDTAWQVANANFSAPTGISGQNLYFNFTDVLPGIHWFRIMVWVNSSMVVPGQELSNFVNLNHTDDLGYEMIGSYDWANCTVATPILTISKSPVIYEVYPGDIARYIIWVNNTGTDATGRVWVNETFPAGLTYYADGAAAVLQFVGYGAPPTPSFVSFVFGDIQPGQGISFWVDALVATSVQDNTNLTNWAFCNYTAPGGYKIPDEPRDSATVRVISPIITVEKGVDRTTAYHGDIITYTIWYNNTGHAPAGHLWVNDTLPSYVIYQSDTSGLGVGDHVWIGQWHSWHFTNVAVGTHSFTVTVMVNTSAPIGTWLNNSANWTYTSPNNVDPGEGNQTSNVVSTLVLGPAIAVSKVVDASTAQPGQVLTYTIYFNNTGICPALRVWINDTLPLDVVFQGHTAANNATHTLDSWGRSGRYLWFNFTNVMPGDHWFTVSVRVNNDAQNGTWANNTVTCDYIAPNSYHYDRTSDTASTLIYRPMITIEKDVDFETATLYDFLNYTIYFNNTDVVSAAWVWINDTLPDGVAYVNDTAWQVTGAVFVGVVIVGQKLYFTFTDVAQGTHWFNISVRVNYTTILDRTVENIAACDVATPYATIEHSEASATTRIIRPWIVVNKTGPNPVGPGEVVQFWIFFHNFAPSPAAYVWINDTLPAGVTFISHDAANVSGAVFAGNWTSGLTLYFNFTDVQPGPHSFIINVRINATVPEGAVMWNNVTLNYTTWSWQTNVTLEQSWKNISMTATGVNITVVKDVDMGWATPGDFLNYTIRFTNLGSENAAYVWINDTLPAGVTFISHDAAGVSGAVFAGSWTSGLTLYFNFTDVQPGVHFFNITVRVNSAGLIDGQPLTNWAFLDYTDAHGNLKVGSSDSATTEVRMPQITVEKTVDQSVVYAGATLVYTIYFNNTGNGTASYVWINDTLPAGVTWISDTNATAGGTWTGYWNWTFTNVLPGAHSFTITVTTDTALANGTVLTNYASLNYTDLNLNLYPWSAGWANTTVLNLPNIVVEKAVNKMFCWSPDWLNYTIWFNNTGSADAGWVNITDILPSGVNHSANNASDIGGTFEWSGQYLYFNFTNVAPGTYWFWINVTVNSSLAQGTWLNNTAFLNYTNFDGTIQLPMSQANATTIVTNVSMVVVKVTANATADPGDIIQYTIYFNVTGTENARWVNITDTLPAGVTYLNDTAWLVTNATFIGPTAVSGQYLWFNFTNVSQGAHSFLLNATVSAGLFNGMILENWAFLNFTNATGVPMLPSKDNATTIVTAPIIMVEKTPSAQYADPGDLVTFTIWFNNTGSGTASYVWINDTLPSGLSYVSDTSGASPTAAPYLASNGTSGQYLWFNFTGVDTGVHSFTITARVGVGLSDGSVLTNWAWLNCTDANDNTLAPSSDSADVIVTAPIMILHKTAAPTVVYAGEYVNFTIIFENAGSGIAAYVWINDTLPSWVTYVGNTASSVSGYFSSSFSGGVLRVEFRNLQPDIYFFDITVRISGTAPPGELENWAFMNSTDANGNPLPQRYDYAKVWVLAPDITVVKTVSMETAYPNATLVYTICFDNMGSGNASYVWINDTLPSWVTYISDTSASVLGVGSASSLIIGNRLYFNFTNVSQGPHSFTITVRINSNAPHGAYLVNAVYCNYSVVLKYPETKAWAYTTVIRPIIDVGKSVSQYIVSPEDVLTYYIWINNTGAPAPYLWLNDTLPSGVTYLWDTAEGIGGFRSRTVSGLTISIYFESLSYGMHFFSITVLVNDTSDPSIIDGLPLYNLATVEYMVPTNVKWWDSDSALSYVRFPVVEVEKWVERTLNSGSWVKDNDAYPNELMRYRIRVENTGSVVSPVVRVIDTLPAEVIYITSTQGSPSISGNNYTWTIYNLGAGQTWEIFIYVRVRSDAANGLTLTNSVLCNYTYPNGVTALSPSDEVSTLVIRPVIQVSKIALQPTAYPGELVTFCIYFNNTGLGDAYRIWINDTLPAGMIYEPSAGSTPPVLVEGQRLGWVFRNVAPGTINYLTFTARVLETVPYGTVLNDTAYLNYTGPRRSNYLRFEETVDWAEVLVIAPEITMVKIVSMDRANPGDTLLYTLCFNNTGNGNAVNVVIEDVLPEWVTYLSASVLPNETFGRTLRWNIGTLAPGEHNITITVRIDPETPDNTILVNNATCTYGTPYVTYPPTEDSAETLVVKPIIVLSKVPSAETAGPGDILAYTITISNTGSDIARYLWLNETIPTYLMYLNDSNATMGAELISWNMTSGRISWLFANVSTGMHAFVINFTVDPNMEDKSPADNEVTCAYTARNLYKFPEERDSAIVMLRRAIITVEKGVDLAAAAPGSFLNYTIYFNNSGSGAAGYVWINDTLPSWVTYLNDTASSVVGANFVSRWISGDRVCFNFTNVQPGRRYMFLVSVLISPEAYGTLENVVELEYTALSGCYLGYSIARAFTWVLAAMQPPQVQTTAESPVYAGFNISVFADVWDDIAVDTVLIYYVDIEGNWYSGIMVQTAGNISTRIGTYEYTIPPQTWKGIVSYFVWVNDTQGLWNATGWNDIIVLLPPYIVWGTVYSNEGDEVGNAFVIVLNNDTKDSALTVADINGTYSVNLAEMNAGYQTGQELILFGTDMLWYGFAYGEVNITHYSENPEMPPGTVNPYSFPYDRIDITLNAIPEFSGILAPVLALLVLYVIVRRRKRK
ncbi:MAG: hypothetical protein AB1665_02860 [Candidatus Thermoplasmatota archaeon]